MTVVQASESMFTVPAEVLSQIDNRLNAYLQTLEDLPHKRDGAFPYYLFHGADEPIHGTVMLFHGYSARPHQMWRLADYLFKNGFNVYQCTLAGHSQVRPDLYWPQVHLKPEIKEPLKAKVRKDPVLKNFFKNIKNAGADQATTPSSLQMLGLVRRLQRLDAKVVDLILAIERDYDPDFDQYYDSNHLDYLTEAEARLEDLAAMPGPIYTVGVSVGGAVALGLAAAHPQRIKKVVAYAPLLEVYGETRERYVKLTGLLNIKEFDWDNLSFPLGCCTAANRFGAFVRQQANAKVLKKMPTLFVLTENENAADFKINQQFARSLGREAKGHYIYTYPVADLVPHSMVDPTEVSQNMSNVFWQTMYQETFRFLALGQFDGTQMANTVQDIRLPVVPDIETG